jgi:hypothetical protein
MRTWWPKTRINADGHGILDLEGNGRQKDPATVTKILATPDRCEHA